MTSIEEIKAISEEFKKSTSKTELPSALEKILNLYNGYLAAPDTFFDNSATELHFLQSFTGEIIKYLTSLTTTEVSLLIIFRLNY